MQKDILPPTLTPPYNTAKFLQISSQSGYAVLQLTPRPVHWHSGSLHRAMAVMHHTGATVLYSDYIDEGVRCNTIPWQQGAIRNDFDFGYAVIIDLKATAKALTGNNTGYTHAAWYDLWLKLSRENGGITHLPEPLYTVSAEITQATGSEEAQFAYVDPRNRLVQLEMEKALTNHLIASGAIVSQPLLESIDVTKGDFPVEASVVIPVRNRCRTIAQAVDSALAQITDFNYNVIVIDNRSDDGTTVILDRLAQEHHNLHIIDTLSTGTTPPGIGGCWNMALQSPLCGRFAVQLDSDDLYQGPDTLQRIVDAFREQGCAMVVGSYTLTDFDGNILPPGLIDHAEWTPGNGPNNALRINGLGAPRAFYTPVARANPLPDTCYGEDYAIGLALSGKYKIGRIYDSLYLCRRWEDNSDHNPTRERINANNFYKDTIRTIELKKRIARNAAIHKDFELFHTAQLSSWPLLENNHNILRTATAQNIGTTGAKKILLTHRRSSASADLNAIARGERPCFLCRDARPKEQGGLPWGDYEILANPYPVTPGHLTVCLRSHSPQAIKGRFSDMLALSAAHPDWTVFYNGPRCGASAPDHHHFQMFNSCHAPFHRHFINPIDAGAFRDINSCRVYVPSSLPYGCISVQGGDTQAIAECIKFILRHLSETTAGEPMVNILCTSHSVEPSQEIKIPAQTLTCTVIPRRAHRPSCYGTENGKMLISPASVEMMGLFPISRPEDFEALTPSQLQSIYSEVTFSRSETIDFLRKL